MPDGLPIRRQQDIKGTIVQKLFVVFPVLFLTGCFFIIEVNQPASGIVDETFTVTVEVEVNDSCDTATCLPLFGIAMPPDWVIESCEYSGDVSGVCEEDTSLGVSIGFGPTDPDNEWFIYVGENEPYFLEERASVTWVVRPTSEGDFILDYAAGGYASDSDGASAYTLSENDASLDHPITIQQQPAPQPIPVPGLGVIGILMLVLGMFLMLLVWSNTMGRRL